MNRPLTEEALTILSVGGLKLPTPTAWTQVVLSDFDRFLQDHAANERKASAMAMSMVAHYPDRTELVEAMIDLALEELNHFRQVVRLMLQRNVRLGDDEKDPYVNDILRQVRKGTTPYFIDRLLSAAVIEARGAERFSLLAEADLPKEVQTFYRTLARSEANHHQLFVRLATRYFPAQTVEDRLVTWLDIEASAMAALEIRPRLH